MTAGPQTPYDTPRNIELLRAANDGARLFRAVFVSFAVVALYFLIIALSADDELLFKDGPLRAPILNVSVRASHYFIGAPCILLLLHFNVLIQASLLVGKVTDYKRALCPQQVHELKPEMLRLLLPVPLVQIAAGYSSSVPQWALKLFNFLTLSVLPLVTLGVLRTQFLAFQDSWITGLHSVVLVTDGLLVAAVLAAGQGALPGAPILGREELASIGVAVRWSLPSRGSVVLHPQRDDAARRKSVASRTGQTTGGTEHARCAEQAIVPPVRSHRSRRGLP